MMVWILKQKKIKDQILKTKNDGMDPKTKKNESTKPKNRQ